MKHKLITNNSPLTTIKKGYKNTEIGVIPEDWDVMSFENAFHFLSTASYSRAEIMAIGKIKYVHYGDIHTKLNHFLDFNSFELPSIKKEQLNTYNLIKEGDLIMADASEDYEGIGKSVEVKNIGNKKAISGLHTFLLRGKEGVFSNGFKAYLHSNRIVKTQYDKLATGLKVYGVSKGNLKLIQIPLPPLPEQTAIATVLSDTDNLLQALEKKIAKKRLIKQGAMQVLLNPMDNGQLTNDNEDNYQLSTVNYPLKKGWVVKTLGEVAEIATGTTPPTNNAENYGGEYCFVSPADLGKGKYIDKSIKNLSKKGFSISRVFPIYSIMVTCIGSTIGKIGIASKVLTSNQQINVIFPNDNYISEYLYYQLSLIANKIRLMASEQAVPMINKSEFSEITIPIPTKQEQTRIATILSDMDTEIETIENQLAKYKQVKQGLMQNLLTGKIRLNH